MSLEFLEAALENAHAKANRIRVVPQERRKDPLDMLTSNSGMFSDTGYGGEFEQEQYDHYTGRFYSGVRVITSRLASQPVLVARQTDSPKSSASSLISSGAIPPNAVPPWLGNPDKLDVLFDHPLWDILHDPNRHHTPYVFWDMISASVMVTGRGFIVALPRESVDGEEPDRALDLFPIPATWMRPLHDNGAMSSWVMKPPRSTRRGIKLTADQVCHFYFADPSNPIAAISPLSMVAKSVLADEAISSAQYSEFNNGGMPKVALIAGDVMNETGFTDDPNRTSAARPVRLEPYQRDQIIDWFQQQYAGVQKRGLPIVLDAIIRDLKFLSHTPEEMAYTSSASLTKEQIFEGIGVSKILTGQLEGVTRASGALAEQFFVDYSLNPLLTMISQSLTKRLARLYQQGDDKLFAWISPAVHRDPEVDIEYLRLGIRSYAMTRNDVRTVLRTRFGGLPNLEGMDDVIIPDKLEERDPDEHLLSVNRVEIGEEADDSSKDEGAAPEDEN